MAANVDPAEGAVGETASNLDLDPRRRYLGNPELRRVVHVVERVLDSSECDQIVSAVEVALSEGQLVYARWDVRYLLPLAKVPREGRAHVVPWFVPWSPELVVSLSGHPSSSSLSLGRIGRRHH